MDSVGFMPLSRFSTRTQEGRAALALARPDCANGALVQSTSVSQKTNRAIKCPKYFAKT